jgi:hypothetical protein
MTNYYPGSTHRQVVSDASINATVIKDSAGQIVYLNARNNSRLVRHLKLYDKATAPDPATDKPFQVISLFPQAGPAMMVGAINFKAGIALTITARLEDTDTGPTAVDDVIVKMNVL